MTADSDDVELRHKSGESLELQAALQSPATTVTVRRLYFCESSTFGKGAVVLDSQTWKKIVD